MIHRFGLCMLVFISGAVVRAEGPGLDPGDNQADSRSEVSASPSSRRLAGPKPEPITPPTPDELDRAIRRGVDFLLADQNPDGSWGSPHRTKGLNVYAPVPGAHHAFRTAVTALCIAALIDVQDDREDVQQALDRGEAWLLEKLPRLRRATGDAIYNVWGHAYAIQALVRMHRCTEGEPRRRRIEGLIRSQYDFLTRYESVDGGWGYYDFRVGAKRPASSSISFVAATVLVAFHEARSIGVDPPEDLAGRAIAAIKRQQKPDFSYMYGEYLKYRPMRLINRPGGSLGRSQACNVALRLWGDPGITDDVLRTWLDRLFARNGWLGIGRKRPVPHEAWFQVAGYFYYYGHYYAALCIEQLEPADRPRFQGHLAAQMLVLQEKDGSWWDYPLYNYHQQYGTAYGLLTLTRCRSTSEAPPRRN